MDAKGRVYPCCYLVNTDQVMGNINDASFGEIWHGEPYRRFRKQLLEGREQLDGCATCPRDDQALLEPLRRFRWLLPSG